MDELPVVLQQPHRLPAQLAQPAGDQDSISWRLLPAAEETTERVESIAVLQREGADTKELLFGLLLTWSLEPKSGGENWAARWGEKKSDVAVVSTGRKPPPLLPRLEFQQVYFDYNIFSE